MGIGSMRWLLCAVLLVLAGQGQAHPLGAARVAMADSALGQLPDSVRTKIFTALAVGEVESAVAAYMVHKGLHDAPTWLRAFQTAFNAANRTVGPCQRVAKDIYTAFVRFGARPEYISIRTRDSRYLVFDLPDGTSPTISYSGYHVVVRSGDKIYDAFTGPSGMVAADYMGRLQATLGYDLGVVVNP
jgi:hypothetical protein